MPPACRVGIAVRSSIRMAAVLPVRAQADWIVFVSGGAMEVGRIEADGSRIRLTRPHGGWVTAPEDRKSTSPVADFYLVYTEVDETRGGLRPRNGTIIAKVNYILDF
jgi:hypothetical protein